MALRFDKIALFLILFEFAQIGKSQEIGHFPIRNFNHREYSGHAQSWAITQDHRGLIYIANNVGVIEYDGSEWRHISINGALARCLDIDSQGRIWVGGQDEIGYLAADSSGNLRYVSLVGLLPETSSPLGLVRRVYATDNGIYFSANQCMILIKGNNVKVWKPKTYFHRTYQVSGQIFTHQPGYGLSYIKGDSLLIVPGGEKFTDELIYLMLPHWKDKILIGTYTHGFFDYDAKALLNPLSVNSDSLITPFKTSNDKFFKENQVYYGAKLPDSNFAIGTFMGGAVFMNQNGRITRSINRENGLQDDAVWYMFLDNQDNIWIALNNGISYTAINSQLTSWSESMGIRGTLQSVVRFNKSLYITSNIGVFKKEESLFKPVEGISTLCNKMLVAKTSDGNQSLLVATSGGVYQVLDREGKLVENGNLHAYSFVRSKVFPDIFYVGLNTGVGVLNYKHGKWRFIGKFEQTQGTVYSLVEDANGNLWYSLRYKGVCRCNVVNPYQLVLEDLRLYNNIPFSPRFDDMSVSIINNQVKVATDKGLSKYNPVDDRFVPDSSLGLEFVDGKTGIRILTQDSVGNIWFEAYKYNPNRWVERAIRTYEGTYRRIPAQFRTIPEMIFNDVFVEPNDLTWIAASDGLYRYDGSIGIGNQSNIKLLIRQVIAGEQKKIFNGTFYRSADTVTYKSINPFQLSDQVPELSYHDNSVVISYASPFFGQSQKLVYSHFLMGYDKKWSDWTTDQKKEYTNLKSGSYKFQVKVKNIFDVESPIVSYDFIIKRPWYKSPFALIFYLFLIGFIIWAVIAINTRILKSTNIRLKKLVDERTSELLAYQKEIVEKNEALQQQKEEMQTQRDEMQDIYQHINESLQYAKTIQQAILPDLSVLDYLFEHFLLFRPKDVVSGDFYWTTQIAPKGKQPEKVFVAVVDCTGHGVPGAFMSMIGSRILNEIVIEHKIYSPAAILTEMNNAVNQALRQDVSESFDGMDISLCLVEKKLPDQYEVTFSGANRPIYYYQKGVHRIQSLRGNRKCIGSIIPDVDPEFVNYKIYLQPGDIIFLNSDGIIDQNDRYKKKFTTARFHTALLSNIDQPMADIHKNLAKSFDEFRGEEFQRDDITVLGLRFKE